MYELKIYFSAEGVENGEKLKELRLELAKRQGRSLLSIYKDFDCLTPVGAVSDEDQLVEVGVNRVTSYRTVRSRSSASRQRVPKHRTYDSGRTMCRNTIRVYRSTSSATQTVRLSARSC